MEAFMSQKNIPDTLNRHAPPPLVEVKEANLEVSAYHTYSLSE